MKRSMVFASREVIQRVTSKPLTSPAKCVANREWSKWVMGPMPDLPASSPCHVSSVPTAIGVTSPIPVTTTLRAMRDASLSARLLRVRFDVVDGVPDGLDLLGVLVRDLDLELLFEREHQLDDRQRVRLQVLGERSLQLDLVGGHLEL